MKFNQPPIIRILFPICLILFAFSAEMHGSDVDNLFPGKTIRINPEFKVSRSSNGKIIVTSVNPNMKIRHEFTDLYADVLLAASRRQSMDNLAENLRKKYYLSKDDCRREIKHAVNVLTDWKIILMEDQVAQKR